MAHRPPLFGCRDIATVAALTARQGSTLVPELLKAYMGEELGFANADKDRRVILPMHSYRLCLWLACSPTTTRCCSTRRRSVTGCRSRCVWTPVRPGVARARRSADADRVEPMTVPVPEFGIDPMDFHTEADDPDVYSPAALQLVPMSVARPSSNRSSTPTRPRTPTRSAQ